jgi:hypothetical protein
MAYLENSTFEGGLGNWKQINLPGPAGPVVIRDGTARSGAAYLAWGPLSRMASIGIDFIPATTDPPRSLCALAYVRAMPNPVPITTSGIMKLWNLSRPSVLDNTDTYFTVGNQWTLIMCSIDIPIQAPPLIRLEFYWNGGYQMMHIDTVNVF